jgi:pimeloyl-ACP methyl ester carboxylesterase
VGKKLEQTVAVLNGLLGDYLERTGNGLATDLGFYRSGRAVPATREGFAAAYPDAARKVVVLVHGVMCTESIWELADGSDYGSLLARDLGLCPLYVRYNSGRAIADNGRELSRLLTALCAQFPVPVEQIWLLGYSMGGLLVRSACHWAAQEQQAWLARTQAAIYVGTPHLGAPAERAGRLTARLLRAIPDPYTRLIADIGDLRSAGVKDLGDAALRAEDRAQGLARGFRAASHPVPLLAQLRHYLIAGHMSADPRLALLFGDAIVPVDSATHGALGVAANELLPEHRVKVLPRLSHVALAHDLAVYEQIKAFCQETSP